MTALLLAVLVQAPPQESSIQDRIEAFLKGDPAAREELLKWGRHSIQPLRKARDKSPKKIDELVFDVKRSLAYPKDSTLPGLLEEKAEFELDEMAAVDALQKFHDTWKISVLCEWNGLKEKTLTMTTGSLRAHEALDRMCRDLGLDFGLYHGLVVIAPAEVLWSAPAFGAPGAERQPRTPEEERTLKLLRNKLTGVDFRGSYVEEFMIFVRELCGIPFDVKVEGKYATYFRASKKDCFSLMSAATQICGLDFMIDKGTVVVDTREAIEKKIAGKK